MYHSPVKRRLAIRILSVALVAGVATWVCVPTACAQAFLEGHYKFDLDEDPLIDSTGNNEAGVLLTNGDEARLGEDSLISDDGSSIGFDAPGINHPTGSFMLIPDFPHPESFSLSIWIKPLLTGQVESIVARDSVWWPSPCNFYCLYVDTLQSLVWKTGGTETILTDEFLIEEDEIHHVVITHLDADGADTGSADRSRLYLDGELVGESDDPTEIPSLDALMDPNNIYTSLWVGTLSSFGGYLGEMDDLQFYSAELTEQQVADMFANPGSLAKFAGADGDYNGDGAVDVLDIDRQAVEMKSENPDLATFDETEDGKVDFDDRSFWVKEHAGTWVGDANLDLEFNSGDLVAVFAAGTYEEVEKMAGWAEGDWNGDMAFDSSDLVVAFADGGYEQGPMANAVPEPATSSLLLIGLIAVTMRRRRCSA